MLRFRSLVISFIIVVVTGLLSLLFIINVKVVMTFIYHFLIEPSGDFLFSRPAMSNCCNLSENVS